MSEGSGSEGRHSCEGIDGSMDVITLTDEATNRTVTNTNQLSKSALKKLKGRERWLDQRKQKRIEEKQRKKNKRIVLREAGMGDTLRRFRGKAMVLSNCEVHIAIDMSFDNLMSEKDRRRTVQQLNWCYSVNRRAPDPLQFHIVSFNGPCRNIYDGIESNRNQDIFLDVRGLSDVFEVEKIVYLTAESENVLTRLDKQEVYVIGGLVDHNSHKGLCLDLARHKGYKHARLPIDEFVQMKTRKVLTINHVFEILVQFSNTGDWEKSFFTVIPKRKEMKRIEETA